jgi:transposase InsO family protein
MLVWLETGAPRRHTRNRRPMAPRRIPLVLESDPQQLSTPHSPWQRAYVERVIGSIRRECLDHVIVFDERSLRRILSSYFNYFLRSRTHLFPIRAVITPAYEKRGAPPAG